MTDQAKDIAGGQLERETERLLRLIASNRVERQVELGGKKLDVFLTTSGHFVPTYRVGVECKDWKRPLTREQCAQVVADYLPLLDQRLIDKFLLITTNGIVASARKLFDENSKLQHMTFSQLADHLFNPIQLVEDSIRQYADSSLRSTLVTQYAFSPDLAFASMHFDALYNDFIELAIDSNAHNFQRARDVWEQFNSEQSEFLEIYSRVDFSKCIAQRIDRARVDLLELVKSWIIAPDRGYGLAILSSYGMGKSSFAKHLAYELANAYLKNPLRRIPFLIELKDFGSHQDIRGLITHELVNRHGAANGSFDLFQSLNAAGRFVLILDGFDEMKQGMTSDSLLFNFNQLAKLNVGSSRVIICGRPTLFENREEQQRVMSGEFSIESSRPAKYIQVSIAPFVASEACELLEAIGEHTTTAVAKERILNFIKELRIWSNERVREEGYSEVIDLLSRPVHIPMLASVLPRRALHPKSLTRALLYTEFIDAIIERELFKRPPEFGRSYDTKTRREFAQDVAVQMARTGESRSIRTSELPLTIFQPFVTKGRPLESVRRDLVSACFLERKGEDILYFPHKSFWEFLVAERVVREVRSNSAPNTDGVGFQVTREIFAFIQELLLTDDWEKLALHAPTNGKLLHRWIKQAGNGYHLTADIFVHWAGAVVSFDRSLQEAVAMHIESAGRQSPEWCNAASQVARELVKSDDVVIAVHAYRAITKLSASTSVVDQVKLVGALRLVEWTEKKWVELSPEAHDACKMELVKLLVEKLRTRHQHARRSDDDSVER